AQRPRQGAGGAAGVGPVGGEAEGQVAGVGPGDAVDGGTVAIFEALQRQRAAGDGHRRPSFLLGPGGGPATDSAPGGGPRSGAGGEGGVVGAREKREGAGRRAARHFFRFWMRPRNRSRTGPSRPEQSARRGGRNRVGRRGPAEVRNEPYLGHLREERRPNRRD